MFKQNRILVCDDVTWSNGADRVYEVFLKGQLEMGGFVSLVEHVEYIGTEMVYRHGDEQ